MAVIRVSGYPGSGKTTACVKLAEQLKYEYFYAGKILRDLAMQQHLAIEEFYALLIGDPTLEKSVDKHQEELMATHGNLIVEGRIAPFLPCPFQTINILLTVDPRVGAKRQHERPENSDFTLTEVETRTRERLANEREHYQSLYGIDDHFDAGNFQIVIDTSTKTPEEVLVEILSQLKERFEIIPQ